MIAHDLQVLLAKLEQILQLEADCSDFGPVRDRGSLPHPIFSNGDKKSSNICYKKYTSNSGPKSGSNELIPNHPKISNQIENRALSSNTPLSHSSM